jgi:sarcosine oxidase subunit beta
LCAFTFTEDGLDSADVIIIGGGIVGSSIAYHLTGAGCPSVLVIERETQQGKGSTGKSMGGVRAQFSDELNIAIALRSLEAFDRFAERPGVEIGLHKVGYLFLLDRQQDVAVFERSVALEREDGLAVGNGGRDRCQRRSEIGGNRRIRSRFCQLCALPTLEL